MVFFNPQQQYYGNNYGCYNENNNLNPYQEMMYENEISMCNSYGVQPLVMNPYMNPLQAMFGMCNSFINNFLGSQFGGFLGRMLSPMLPFFGQQQPVAANEEARAWGDPHFIGADGQKFDFQGQAGKNYNLLSDSGLQFNGHFESYGNGKNVIGKTGLTVEGLGGYSSVDFNKEGVATVNGIKLRDGQSVRLADGGTASLHGNQLSVTTAEGYTINETTNGTYLDVDVKSGQYGVGMDGRMPGGLIGQTFHPDWESARPGELNPEAYAQRFEVNRLEPYSPWPTLMA
ncbi:MAG: hypothetical protein AB1782_00090 [Cyanobacteriota bacterium]